MRDPDLEEPVTDAFEQQQDAFPAVDEAEGGQTASVPLEANEADVAEQAQEFNLEEDEYR